MTKLDDILTLAEAAKKYGLSDGAVLRKALKDGKFKPTECRKSEGTWLITKKGMDRVYGEKGR